MLVQESMVKKARTPFPRHSGISANALEGINTCRDNLSQSGDIWIRTADRLIGSSLQNIERQTQVSPWTCMVVIVRVPKTSRLTYFYWE